MDPSRRYARRPLRSAHQDIVALHVCHLLPTVGVRCVKVGGVVQLKGHHVVFQAMPPKKREYRFLHHLAVWHTFEARLAQPAEKLAKTESLTLDLPQPNAL